MYFVVEVLPSYISSFLLLLCTSLIMPLMTTGSGVDSRLSDPSRSCWTTQSYRKTVIRNGYFTNFQLCDEQTEDCQIKYLLEDLTGSGSDPMFSLAERLWAYAKQSTPVLQYFQRTKLRYQKVCCAGWTGALCDQDKEFPRTPAADYTDEDTKSHIFTAIIVLLTVLILVVVLVIVVTIKRFQRAHTIIASSQQSAWRSRLSSRHYANLFKQENATEENEHEYKDLKKPQPSETNRSGNIHTECSTHDIYSAVKKKPSHQNRRLPHLPTPLPVSPDEAYDGKHKIPSQQQSRSPEPPPVKTASDQQSEPPHNFSMEPIKANRRRSRKISNASHERRLYMKRQAYAGLQANHPWQSNHRRQMSSNFQGSSGFGENRTSRSITAAGSRNVKSVRPHSRASRKKASREVTKIRERKKQSSSRVSSAMT